MKRAGFTLIELIFVVVILGILAAVAIPKLSDTRDFAGGTKIANNLATCINEQGAVFLMDGNFTYSASSTTNTPACKDAESCFTITPNAGAGTLTVALTAGADGACLDANTTATANSSIAIHNF